MFSTILLTLQSKVSPAETVYQEANGLLNIGKYLDAIEKYTEAIKLDSRHLEAYANRGFNVIERLPIALRQGCIAVEYSH